MKTCPNCHTQYTDDTLRFCLQDGAPLDVTPVTQQPTVSLAGQEMETVARQSGADSGASVATQWKQQSQVTHIAPSPRKGSGSKAVLAAIAAALVLLLFAGAGAVGLWLYLSDRGEETAYINGNGNRNGTQPDNNSSITPSPTRTEYPSPTPTATVTVPNYNRDANSNGPGGLGEEDNIRASREVSQQVYNWKSNTESGDLNSQMRRYASSVDYYRRRGATPEFIRADKMRAYRMFNSMSVTISNMNVTVGDAGNSATAVFDKEWVFEGSRRSTGKVRQQLQFRKVDGQWLITAERDIKVYYTN